MQIELYFDSKLRKADRAGSTLLPRLFGKVKNLSGPESTEKNRAWVRLLLGGAMEIEAGGKEFVELDTGKPIKGRIRLGYRGGDDGLIRIGASKTPFSEANRLKPDESATAFELKTESGLPSSDSQALYCIPENMFRYLQLEIRSGTEPVVLTSLDYEEYL